MPARSLSCLPLGLLSGVVACAPSYQPEPSQPAPAATHQTQPAPAPEDAIPMARTPIPSDGPLRPHQSPPPPQPQPQPSNLDPRFQAILDRHNLHRADHCAAPLRWSTELQAVAQDWANQLKNAGCAFEHRQGNRFGENLTFFAPVGSRSPEDVATGWYNEVSLHDFSQGDFDFRTGHFTQVVWRSTQSVGCGISRCNGGEIWVCNYDPPGNLMGSFQSQVVPTSCQK